MISLKLINDRLKRLSVSHHFKDSFTEKSNVFEIWSYFKNLKICTLDNFPSYDSHNWWLCSWEIQTLGNQYGRNSRSRSLPHINSHKSTQDKHLILSLIKFSLFYLNRLCQNKILSSKNRLLGFECCISMITKQWRKPSKQWKRKNS